MAPLIVITGPTASGKTGLAIELARQYGGEIVCADSRTIYKGMDIGTAKPTSLEQARVPHHLLDVVEPGERYTAQDFQRDATRVIDEIRARGNVPFLVGGTGLYIDAVTLEFDWPEQREVGDLGTKTITELQAMLKAQQLPLPANFMNKRHLVNALRRDGKTGNALTSPRENTFVVAIATDSKELEDRIELRAHEMFKVGVVDETKRLAKLYGWGNEAMKSNIYPIVKKVISGELTEAEAIALFVTKDRQLAKRQITWLKRHDYVQWLSLDEARVYLETKMQIIHP